MFFLPALRPYRWKAQLLPDTVAGMTVGALAIPQSMSYALIAGLPVQNGLYSDLQVAYPILGQSKHLVVGPVAVMSLLTFQAVSSHGSAEPFTETWIVHCSFLSLSVSLVQATVYALGAGRWVSRAVSDNTIKAFTMSAAFTIVSTQLRALTGSSSFGGLLHSPNISTWLVSLASLLVLEGVKVVYPSGDIKSKLGSLAILVLGCACSYTGLVPSEVSLVGFIPHGLPSSSPLSRLQLVDMTQAFSLFLYSIPMSLVGFAEAFAIAKVDQSVALDGDKEFLALALANLWTSFLGGFPITGSFSRSAVNREAGCTSPMSNFVAAFLVVMVLQLFTHLLGYLPKPCVASVVVSAVVRLVDIDYVRSLWEDPAQLVSFMSVLVTGLLGGVELGLFVGFCADRVIAFTRESPVHQIV